MNAFLVFTSVVPPQCRYSTFVWLLLGYPVVAVVHSLACMLSWLLVFTIPVAKMNARMLHTILLMAPEDIHVRKLEKVQLKRPWLFAPNPPKAAENLASSLPDSL